MVFFCKKLEKQFQNSDFRKEFCLIMRKQISSRFKIEAEGEDILERALVFTYSSHRNVEHPVMLRHVRLFRGCFHVLRPSRTVASTLDGFLFSCWRPRNTRTQILANLDIIFAAEKYLSFLYIFSII